MHEIYLVDPEEVKSVEWTGDPKEYDLSLHSLGPDDEPFIIQNPWLKDSKPFYFIEEIPETDKCVVFKFNDEWVAKYFPVGWDVDSGYENIEIVLPKFVWRKNPDLDRTMNFHDDPMPNYEPDPWEAQHELVWYMDPRFNPLEEKIWAVSCKPIGKPVRGIKDMGYLTPNVDIVFNEELPLLDVNIDDICPPYYNLAHECAYQLDPKFTPFENIWAVKFIPAYRKPKPLLWLGTITPELKIEYNPNLPKLNYELEYEIPWRDLKYEHVWMLAGKHCQNAPEEIWAIKVYATKEPEGTKIIGELTPKFLVSYNSELPETDYEINYDIPYHDLAYEHVWMLDMRHQINVVEDIWAVKMSAVKKPIGSKIVGEASPVITLEYNPELPSMSYVMDYNIPYHDLEFKHVWMLDRKHTYGVEDIWAVKASLCKKPKGEKYVGWVSPEAKVEVNPDVDGFEFNIDYYTPQYYDLAYEHVWKLDKEYAQGFDIWAVKVTYVDKPIGYKDIEYTTPTMDVLYNPDLNNLKIKIEYQIPYHDRAYVHVWYLDKKFTNGERIWAAKMIPGSEAKGEKDMGVVQPIMPEYLDVVFISYNELNAEENWQRVLEKAPYAKRVDGVTGIFEAHKKAAQLSDTDMFYVVDGDAYLTDQWKFNYQPGLFDRDCAYVWSSRNPINDLTYGYGGVKLFSKRVMMRTKKWKDLDMTTGVMSKMKVISKISNITAFNTDEFSTWRSAFRECVKLCYNKDKQPDVVEHSERLTAWLSQGEDKPFGPFAIDGAKSAVKFYNENKDNFTTLMKINDRAWLEKYFKKQGL